MSQPPDLANLAKRYVALWQDYVSATAADPELAEMLARLVAGASAMAAQWLRQWPVPPHARAAPRPGEAAAPAPPFAAPHRERPGPTEPGAANAPRRPASAAAAPDERDRELARLARRLSLIEERLAALESPARRQRAGARGTARRRRS